MVKPAGSKALFRPSPVYITISSVVGFGGLLGVQLFVNYRQLFVFRRAERTHHPRPRRHIM